MSRVLAAVILAVLLASCSKPAQVNKDQTEKPATKPIEGYGNIKFGESFNDVMLAHPSDFEPYDIKQCYQNLPLAGCVLISRDETPPQIRDGVPYKATVWVNQLGKVTDVNLDFDRKGNISATDCRSIHERTLDWLARDYGTLYDEITPKAAQRVRTSDGNTYLDTPADKDGNWVSTVLRTGVRGSDVHKQSYIELRTTYIITDGEPHCDVEAEFHDAPTVSRPDPFKAMDIEFGNGSDAGE